jgi:hypothetical protein
LLFVPCIHALFYSIREFNLKKPCNLAIAGLWHSPKPVDTFHSAV